MTAAPPFRMRSLGWSVYLPTFLFAVGQGATIPVIPLFATNLGASVALASLIVGLRGFGTMVFDLPSGALVSRFGERWAMLIGTLALGIVAVGAALTRSPLVFAGLVFVMGAAWSIWLLARLAYVTERAPVEVRGRAMSLLGGTNRIGNFIGPLIGGVLADRVGLASTFYFQAALAVSACVVMFVMIGDGDAPMIEAHGSLYRRFAGVLTEHHNVFLTAGVGTLIIQMLRAARSAALPLWGQHIGLSAGEISVIFSLTNAMEVVLFYPVGMMMDRLGRKWVAVPCLLIMAVGMAVVPLTSSFIGLALAGGLTGVGNGFGAGIVMTLGADFSPAIGRSEFLGVWRLVGDIGTTAGPAMIGGIAAAATLGVSLVSAGAMGLVGGAVMLLFVREPLHRTREVERG